MTIAIDIDDTITNSIEAVRYFLKKYGHLYSNSNEVSKYEEEIMRGTFISDVAIRFFHDHSLEIGEKITIKKDAKEVIDKLHEEGNKIIIITARSDNYYGNAQEYCEKYLKKHKIYYDKLITRQTYKHKTCKNEGVDIMIDDAIDTCKSVEKLGMKSILFTSELNKDKQTDLTRASSWKEVYNIIHNL